MDTNTIPVQTSNIKKVSSTFASSPGVDKLFTALSKAQGQIGPLIKDAENPYFKSSYADLAACREAINKPFAENGLCVLQPSRTDGGTVYVRTIIGHASGQWIAEELGLKPTKQDPQGVGSALTYGRRYGLMGMSGIAPEDDDGNAASPEPKSNKPPVSKRYPPPENNPPVENKEYKATPGKKASEAQIKMLFAKLYNGGGKTEDLQNYIKQEFDLTHTRQLDQVQFQKTLSWVMEG